MGSSVQVVGAGEIAVSDHRSSWPSTAELLGLATDARLGGMLTGKRGVLHLHVGDVGEGTHPHRPWRLCGLTGNGRVKILDC